MPRQNVTFFLFPLTNVNLFPSTTKPLQIFEERYIQMIQDAIIKKIPVALCFVPEGSQEIRPLAGFGYPKVVETRPDGTLLIFIIGAGKVHLDLQNLHSADPYLITAGKIIHEEYSFLPVSESKFAILHQVLVRWIKKHVQNPAQQEIFLRSLVAPKEIIAAFAAYLVNDYDLQYELMQIHALENQIQFLHRLLESGELTNR